MGEYGAASNKEGECGFHMGRDRTRPQALVYAKREASASAERHILQILRQRTRPDCLSSFFGAAAAAVGDFPLLAVLVYVADEYPAL